eukprot:6466481-Amphidinium_carterae.1
MEPPFIRVLSTLSGNALVTDVFLDIGICSVDAVLAADVTSAQSFYDFVLLCAREVCPRKASVVVVDYGETVKMTYTKISGSVESLDHESVLHVTSSASFPVALAPEETSQQNKDIQGSPVSTRSAHNQHIVLVRDKEAKKHRKWTSRLQAICLRARGSAKIATQFDGPQWSALSDSQKQELRNTLFANVSFRTLKIYVREWEKFEQWCSTREHAVYPLNCLW